MSFELKVLVAATFWGFIQLVAAAQTAIAQYDLKWAAGSRDVEMPPLKPIAGRVRRNFRNYMETFPFFATAVLVAQVSGIHNELTYWGSLVYITGRIAYTVLYVLGVPLVRSLFWIIASFGAIAVLAAPLMLR